MDCVGTVVKDEGVKFPSSMSELQQQDTNLNFQIVSECSDKFAKQRKKYIYKGPQSFLLRLS